MKRFCAVLCAFVLVIVLGLPVAAEGINGSAADIAPDIMAPAAYVVNLDTNIVVYEKNSETPLQAASLTKMMTTLLLLENYQDQLDTISVTAPSYIYDLIWEKTTNASTAGARVSFSMDSVRRCVSKSNRESVSISSPQYSRRTGLAASGVKMSRMPPRWENCPVPSICAARS